MKVFTVGTDDNLKDFTDAVYPQGSMCLSILLRGKDIKVNGVRVNSNVRLHAGDEVVYYTKPSQEALKSHDVVFEDENMLICDKESGVSSEGLSSELCESGEYYPCHRLDRNTRGLIVFAKTRASESEITRAFKDRRVEKIYSALCKNAFTAKEGTLLAYLTKNERESSVRISDKPTGSAVKIITRYEVLRAAGDVAEVKVILHTGKTHQIRAHMAFIGCPVLGDEKYGDVALNRKYGLKRQQLIAKTLVFDFDGKLSYLNGRKFESKYDSRSSCAPVQSDA